MLQSLEIPRERWIMFMRSFNKLLAERPVRIEVVGRPLGDQEMADLRPFHGIDYDAKGSERDTITLTVGGEDGELSHRVVGPTRLYLGQQDGVIEWLAIEETGEAGDVTTLVHFERVPELEAAYPPA